LFERAGFVDVRVKSMLDWSFSQCISNFKVRNENGFEGNAKY
jgi:hypothetical protein